MIMSAEVKRVSTSLNLSKHDLSCCAGLYYAIKRSFDYVKKICLVAYIQIKVYRKPIPKF